MFSGDAANTNFIVIGDPTRHRTHDLPHSRFARWLLYHRRGRQLSFLHTRPFDKFCKWGSCYSIFSFKCMFCRSLFVLLYFFFWPLCCLSFFDVRILIAPLVSSNSSIVNSIWGINNCQRKVQIVYIIFISTETSSRK